MKQESVVEQLLPLSSEQMQADKTEHSWEYIYEPDAQTVIDELLVRYVESLIYQAVAENMASGAIGAHGGHEGRNGQRRQRHW